MDKIAVLIPCYNEAITIGKVIRDFKQVLPEATIYVYDNNSSDGTALVEEYLKRGQEYSIECLSYGKGKHQVIQDL